MSERLANHADEAAPEAERALLLDEMQQVVARFREAPKSVVSVPVPIRQPEVVKDGNQYVLWETDEMEDTSRYFTDGFPNHAERSLLDELYASLPDAHPDAAEVFVHSTKHGEVGDTKNMLTVRIPLGDEQFPDAYFVERSIYAPDDPYREGSPETFTVELFHSPEDAH